VARNVERQEQREHAAELFEQGGQLRQALRLRAALEQRKFGV
jgi:hypothetical protein